LFCQAYRQRNDEALDAFADFSFHFWNGLSKLPDLALSLYRGLDKRLSDINDLYHEGNVVHWHYPSSCTSEKSVASKFSNGGTLLSLVNVTKAKSIQVFSLIPSEREYLIDFTSAFDVTISLSCERAKALKQFSSDLPDNVDLVVMSARAPAVPHAVISFAGVSSTASCPAPASAPLLIPSAPPISLTHYQPFALGSSGILLSHLPAPLSPLPYLAPYDVNTVAGVRLDSAHAVVPLPLGTPVRRIATGRSQQAFAPVDIHQVELIDLEGARVGGVGVFARDAAASRQC